MPLFFGITMQLLINLCRFFSLKYEHNLVYLYQFRTQQTQNEMTKESMVVGV